MRPVWLLAVVVVAVWLVLVELDGFLGQLQQEGRGAYTIADLGPFNPAELQDTVKDLLKVWRDAGGIADAAVSAHLLVDTLLFIPAYAVLLGLLLQRARRALPQSIRRGELGTAAAKWPWVLGLVVVADLFENGLRMFVVWGDNTSWLLLHAAWVSTMAKWLFLALALGLLTALVARAGREIQVRAKWLPVGYALWRVRVPCVLIAAWAAFLLFDPTGQAPDLFRRWLDGGGLVLQLVGTLVASAVFGLAAWMTVRRVVLTGWAVRDDPPSGRVLFFVAVAAGLVAWLASVRNLLAITSVLLVVVFLGVMPAKERPSGPRRRATTAAIPMGLEGLQVRRLSYGLAVVPLVTLLIATGSAMVVPAVVLLAGEHPDKSIGGLALAVTVLAPMLALAVCAGGTMLVRWVDERACNPDRLDLRVWRVTLPWPSNLELRHALVAVAAATLCGLAVSQPLQIPPALGSVTIAAAALTLLMVLAGEGQRYGESHRPPVGLGALGFVRAPVATLLGVTFVIASLIDDGSYHDVHRSANPPPGSGGLALDIAWDRWKDRNCVDVKSDQPAVPLVLIANYGGGIRAAYWTGSVLTELLGAPPRPVRDCEGARSIDRVFAFSGISGGAVGVMSYLGHVEDSKPTDWYDEELGRQDFLSVPVSWGLLVDLPRTFIGFGGPDRARRLEEAWEGEIAGLEDDFFRLAGTRTPLVLLGGTQVESGCRLNVSRVRLTALPMTPPPTDCNALIHRSASDSVVDDDARRPLTREIPDAAVTSEVLDYLCDGGSLHRSTAALLSARFPYVSPSGRLSQCESDRHTAIVDGGYAEGSGGQALLDLWARLRPLVGSYNGRGKGPMVVPIFVQIDNHYAKAASEGPEGRTKELFVPPATAGRPDKLDDLAAEQLANARFSTDIPGRAGTTCTLSRRETQRFVRIAPPDSPGVPAPLAWTLSRLATDELDDQRHTALEKAPAATLHAVLTDRGEVALKCRAAVGAE